MKKLLAITLLTFMGVALWAQQTQDVVYFKNGTVVKGQVIAYNQGESGQIKIRAADGSLFIFASPEVEKIEKEAWSGPAFQSEEVNPAGYGGKGITYGLAIGGGGIVGVPFAYHPTAMTAIEIGAYYRPTLVLNEYDDDIEFKGGFMLAGGANLYLKKHYKYAKSKVKLNGIAIKAGRSFGNFSQSFIAFGWASEGFRKDREKQSFVLELGVGMLASHFSGEALYEYEQPDNQLLIYWKLHWKWYRNIP